MDVKLRVVWFSWMMMVPFLWFVMLARRTFRIPELGGPGMITSYLLAFLGFLVAFPGLPSAAVFAGNLVFFVVVAAFEERTIAHSALAQAYASYRQSAGMFLPRRRAPTA
jgi:protein-S-isoprenylcysteine O-methyltransferase Ste14